MVGEGAADSSAPAAELTQPHTISQEQDALLFKYTFHQSGIYSNGTYRF